MSHELLSLAVRGAQQVVEYHGRPGAGGFTANIRLIRRDDHRYIALVQSGYADGFFPVWFVELHSIENSQQERSERVFGRPTDCYREALSMPGTELHDRYFDVIRVWDDPDDLPEGHGAHELPLFSIQVSPRGGGPREIHVVSVGCVLNRNFSTERSWVLHNEDDEVIDRYDNLPSATENLAYYNNNGHGYYIRWTPRRRRR